MFGKEASVHPADVEQISRELDRDDDRGGLARVVLLRSLDQRQRPASGSTLPRWRSSLKIIELGAAVVLRSLAAPGH